LRGKDIREQKFDRKKGKKRKNIVKKAVVGIIKGKMLVILGRKEGT